MKLFQIFNKTPNYKKFNYTPRFYNPEEEERRQRISRIEQEVNAQAKPVVEVPSGQGEPELGYRTRIQGSFAKARQANGNAANATQHTSPALLRMAILLVLTVGFIAYLQYGNAAIYGVLLIIIPLYLFLRFRKLANRGR